MDLSILAQQLWYGLLNGTIYVIFASGLTLAFGVMGIVNLAHGELCMLGAMVVYSLMTYFGMNFFLAAVISVCLLGAFGFVCNRLVIQPLLGASPTATFLSTIGLSYILLYSSGAFWSSLPRRIDTPFSQILHPAGISVTGQSILVIVIATAAIVGLYLLLTKTRIGRTMRATAQNSLGANLIGINIKQTYAYTMILAAALAAVAGILTGVLYSATPNMGQSLLLVAFVVVIVAGPGSIPGTIIVGLSIGILEALFVQYVAPYYKSTFIYGILIIVLLLRPQGLFTQRR